MSIPVSFSWLHLASKVKSAAWQQLDLGYPLTPPPLPATGPQCEQDTERMLTEPSLPSPPVMPMPSTTSRVRRKGTCSGVLRKRPCSKAMPRSMCATSAVPLCTRMLELWRSPRPMM